MRIALACGLCSIAVASLAAPSLTDRANAEVNTGAAQANTTVAAAQTRESFRARINENVVTIMAGSPSGTDLAVIQDLAEVLDDGDNLRVLPMVGKGPEQNIKDVMFLRGVDMGVTQANLLKHFDKTGELGPNLKGQIAYIAKLFNEELHVLVRGEVNDIHELNGSRDSLERSILLAAGKQIKDELHAEDEPALVLAGRGWHPGVIGLVAGRPAHA